MRKKLLLLFLLTLTYQVYAQPTNGLVAKYLFDLGTANADAGNLDGAVFGATLTSDRFGNADKAYSFDGIDDYILLGQDPAIDNLSDAFSISMWFNADEMNSSGSWQGLLTKWNFNTDNEHFALGWLGDGVMYATGGFGNQGNMTMAMTIGSWNHIVFTWQNDGSHNVYAYGSSWGSSNPGACSINPVSPVDMVIGAMTTLDRNFKGKIDDIYIYNRVLTAGEITELANASNPASASLEEMATGSLDIYPNPANSKVTISKGSKGSYHLLAPDGKVIMSGEVNGSKTLEIADLPVGIYFVRITEETGQTTTKQLIKQ